MKPYAESPLCEKCGFTGLLITYHNRQVWPDASGRYRCTLTHEEHLHNRCLRCQHEWAEEPFDAAEKQRAKYAGHYTEGVQ